MFILESLADSAASSDTATNPLLSLVPLILVFIIFFFLVIRPQHKKIKIHNQMLASLKKGDKVISSSGIIGTVTKIDESSSMVNLEIANGVEIKMTKASVTDKITPDKTSKNGTLKDRTKDKSNKKINSDSVKLSDAENEEKND